MIVLKAFFIVVNVLSCLMIIGLVLLQKSKNEGLGLAFGASAGESLFGARAGNVLTKATVVLGIVFMASALVLGALFAQKDRTLMDNVEEGLYFPTAAQTPPGEGLDMGAPVGETIPTIDIPAEPAAEVAAEASAEIVDIQPAAEVATEPAAEVVETPAVEVPADSAEGM